MLLKCNISNSNNLKLKDTCKSYYLDIDETYDVYGIVIYESQIKYFICTDNDDKYPSAYDKNMFIVVDDSIPRDWSLSKIGYYTYIVPDIWNKTPLFYENLLNGCKKEEETFRQIKNKIQKENKLLYLLKKLTSFSLPVSLTLEEIYNSDWNIRSSVNVVFNFNNLITGLNYYLGNLISKDELYGVLEVIELRKDIIIAINEKELILNIISSLNKMIK